jgi:hypothetical protein
MPPVGYEPTILVSERPKTHALDLTATGIGLCQTLLPRNSLLRNAELCRQSDGSHFKQQAHSM